MIQNNMNILIFNNTCNSVNDIQQDNSYILPNLKKIIINVTFPDQIHILKTINYMKYDIIIRTCNNVDKCCLCLSEEIYKEMRKISKRFVLYHKGKKYI
jgi:hypothetical protein